jgi:hypothetical protein
MNNSSQRNAGLALIAFTVLLIFTMGLHPAGGNVQHLIKITRLIVITHAIAIFSLPFGWMGFWGLTKKLGADRFGALLGFAMISLGLVAVMIAAGSNGLIVPIFLQHYKDATPEAIESIRPVLRYSFAINAAFDYVYTGAFCTAILCWSITILRTKLLAAWLGWLGIAIAIGAAIIFASGMQAHSLTGFRLFVTSIVIWILLVGVVLYKEKPLTSSAHHKP